MHLKMTHCKNCGGVLDFQVEEEREYIFCPYCGHKYYVDYRKKEIVITKNVNVTHRTIDDAEVIKARTADRESKNAWLVFVPFIVIILGLLVIPTMIKSNAERQGKISAGYYKDYIGENCDTVEKQLLELGFSNIVKIDMNDSGMLFWTNNTVDSISIDGNSCFDSYSYFYPSDKVIINHH